jgi:hypothetical protein
MPAVRNCGGVVLHSEVRSLHGHIVMAVLLSRCTDNARILLVMYGPATDVKEKSRVPHLGTDAVMYPAS